MAKLEGKKSYMLEGLADEVADWVATYCQIDEIFDEKVICEWVCDNLEPEQVFDDEVLEQWSKENGFVKREEE